MKKLKHAIEKQLKELKHERKVIKEISVFGKNNWTEIDREIKMLEKILEAKDMKLELEDAICDIEDKIENIEENYDSEVDLDLMMTEKEPYENILEMLIDLQRILR